MIPLPFEYTRATSIEDALAKMAASGGDGRFVAGGHSLVPLMKLRLSEPKLLIDIARIPGLSGIRQRDGAIEIGAATVHHEVATSALLRAECPALAEAAALIGDPQVRNRGTLGGNLAHADPAADYPAVIVALDADVQIVGPNGARTVKASAFFLDLFSVNLAPDEIIIGVRFVPARVSAYAKLHQRASHFAIVGVAAVLDVAGGTIKSARVGLTGATPAAIRLKSLEAALAGQPATEPAIEASLSRATAELTNLNSDIHASADYRRAMVPVFARRALLSALGRVVGSRP